MMHPENFSSWMKGIGVGTLFVVMMWGCATPEVEQLGSVPAEQTPMATTAKISRISTESLIGKMRITLEANSEVTYTAFKLTDPLRLVLDLPNMDSSEVSELTFQEAVPVMRITPFQFTDGGSVNSRIEVALSRLVPYQVFSDANKLYIDLETTSEDITMPATSTISALPPGFEEFKPLQEKPPTVIASKPEISPSKIPVSLTPETPASSEPFPKIQEELPIIQPVTVQPGAPIIEIQQPPQTVGGVTPVPGMITDIALIKDLQVTEADGKTQITIYSNKLPEFEVKRSETPPRLTLDLKQSELPPGNEKVVTPDELQTVVKQLRLFQLRKTPDGKDNSVRLLVDLLKPTKHEVKAESGQLTIEFDHQKIFTAAELSSEQAEIVEVPLTTGIEKAIEEETGMAAEEAEFAAEPAIRTPKTDEEQEYKGQLISIHFQEADVLDVLQVIAEVSGLNLVVHPGVSGKVTVHLNNIPWDQALDIVLKMNNLSVEIEGNILRVAQSTIFQQEIVQRVEQQRQQIEARRVQEELEALETRLITINFAAPQSIVGIINQYFQGTLAQTGEREERRGTITVDERTKTLIIQDTAENIRKIEEIVATLDRRTPQVMIEARVVSISSYFQKELGITWGGSFYANAEHGNALDYRFPYSVDIPGFGVNLPGVVSPVFSTGDIQFGSIDDVIAIFARIDAAEKENKTKTLGQPKIFTQDNVAATVSAGQVRRITETTTSAGTTTTTTTDVEATLSLNVTPRVSNDGYITMSVTVSNDAFTASSGTDTTTQTVNSEITVKDGETVVIGGIYQTTESENFSAVPYLHKIPLIGRFFKSNLPNISEKNELLIFLTPRILDRQFLQSEQEGTNISLAY